MRRTNSWSWSPSRTRRRPGTKPANLPKQGARCGIPVSALLFGLLYRGRLEAASLISSEEEETGAVADALQVARRSMAGSVRLWSGASVRHPKQMPCSQLSIDEYGGTGRVSGDKHVPGLHQKTDGDACRQRGQNPVRPSAFDACGHLSQAAAPALRTADFPPCCPSIARSGAAGNSYGRG